MEDKASFFGVKGRHTPAHKVTPFSCFQKLIVVAREHARTEKKYLPTFFKGEFDIIQLEIVCE